MNIRVSVILAATLLAAFMVAPAAEAQVTSWGARGGVYFDETEPFIGIEANIPLSGPWTFVPNVEHAFGDANVTTLNADAHYNVRIRNDRSRVAWVGAGIAALLADDSDFGVNVIVGYGRNYGRYMPFAMIKGIIADDSQLVAGGGMRF